MGDGLRQSLNFAGMKNLRLLLPPIEEQEEIVDYINRKTTEIDRLVVELTYQVEYLKEYKQRLIADVVTGKINVQPN
jgi:restriction endonuclease S subunit